MLNPAGSGRPLPMSRGVGYRAASVPNPPPTNRVSPVM